MVNIHSAIAEIRRGK